MKIKVKKPIVKYQLVAIKYDPRGGGGSSDFVLVFRDLHSGEENEQRPPAEFITNNFELGEIYFADSWSDYWSGLEPARYYREDGLAEIEERYAEGLRHKELPEYKTPSGDEPSTPESQEGSSA